MEDQDVFELDPFDTVLGQENDSDSDSDSDDGSDGEGDMSDISSDGGDAAAGPETVLDMNHIQDMVKKLDAILTLLFEHFQRAHAVTTSENGDDSPRAALPPELPALPPLPPLTPSLSPLSSPLDLPLALPPSSPSQLPDPPSLPKPPPTSLTAQFHTLLSIFGRLVLPTFKSRYTQFLLFFYTSLAPDFADVFLGLLVERALFPSNNNNNGGSGGDGSTHTRAAAAAYIGSFVSRATFVDRAVARRVVSVLCDFLRVHLDAVEEALRIGGAMASGAGNGAQSGVWYAVAQAVFLIFCFRWRDLLEDEEDDGEAEVGGKKKWMPELGVVQRIIGSVLNPLKVCFLPCVYKIQTC